MGKRWKQWDFLFLCSKITVDGDCNHEIRRQQPLGRKAMTNLDSGLKSKDKGPHSQGYGLSSSHVWMWELDLREGRVPKNWCFQTVGLEKTLEIPLDSKGIKPVNPKGNQSWIIIGRTDAESEVPILWPHNVRSWLTRKGLDAGEKIKTKGERGKRGWDG